MKRELRKNLAILVAMFFLPFVLLAQNTENPFGEVLRESFESGIPETWVQENVSGSVNWIVESNNLTYPNGAVDGNNRIAFRNTSGVTNKSVTRLILPAVDVSALFQPILAFSHAQEKWSGDYDTLRILYRSSADANWTELYVFDKYISKWTEEALLLPVSEYCQVAFEASDNLGRGIVIDNVVIRSTPSCFKPSEFWTSNVSNDSIVINWAGSYDAIDFKVKVSETELTEEELASANTPLVLDSVTDGISMAINDLTPGKKYYCYIQSNCGNEISEWLDTTFTTSNIVTVPYFEDFNLGYSGSSKVVSYLRGWYYGGTDGYMPYINTATQSSSNLGAMTSDGTNSLVFSKAPNAGYSGNIPAGTRAYTATPEIFGNVKDLQLSFETMAYYPLGVASERSSVIVGVMVDPEDLSTFVAVDTVDVTTPMLYQEFTVSFENYTGEGKYIAFLSEFNETNRFTLDNLLIENRVSVPKVNFEVQIPSATSIALSFVQKYTSYEVLVSRYNVDLNETTLSGDSILLQKTVADLEVINDLTAGQTVYVYARAINGEAKGLWSRARKIRMPKKLSVDTDYPYTVSFEPKTYTSVNVAYNDVQLGSTIPTDILPIFEKPVNNGKGSNCTMSLFSEADITSYLDENGTGEVKPLARSSQELVMTSDLNNGYDVIAVLPEIDMAMTQVGFHITRRDENYNYHGEIYVGVIKDARDLNSFIAIDTIVAGEDYFFYEYDLSAYAELGAKFFAFKIDDLDGKYYSKAMDDGYVYLNRVFIDDISFTKISACKSPTNVEGVSTGKNPTKATISWDANTGTKWQVRVATTNYDKNTFGAKEEEDALGYEFIYDQEVTTTSVEITGLQFPDVRYYFWIKPICENIESNWSEPRYFETTCYDNYPLPYVQNFDAGIPGDKQATFQVPCVYVKPWYVSDLNYYPCPLEYLHYYPYITNAASVSGSHSFCFNKGKKNANPKYPLHIAFPLMEAPADTLQVEFKAIVNSGGVAGYQEVAVGVMTNPVDPNTFIPVKTISVTSKTKWTDCYAKIKVPFDSTQTSKPTYYVAICGTNNFTQDSLYIDDVIIDYAPVCDEPFNIKLYDVTPSTAQIKWDKNADTTIFLVVNKQLTSDELRNLNDEKDILARNVIKLDTVTTDTAGVTGLGTFGEYFVYLRGYCNGRYTPWTSVFKFRTTCVAQDIDTYTYDFNDDADNACPSCWFNGSTYEGSTSYIGYAKSKKLFLRTIKTAPGAYAITPEFIVDDISKYKVRFTAGTGTAQYGVPSNAGTYSYDRSVLVGIVTDPYDLSTIVIVDTIKNLSVDMRTYEVYFDTYKHDLNGVKGKHVIFQSYAAIQNVANIDDIEFIRIDECPRFLFSVFETTSSSITLTIDSVPATYELKYSTSPATEEMLNSETLPSIICTSNQVVVDSLEPNTTYYFYARSTTGEGCGDWTPAYVAVSGERRIVDLPYYDGFEANKYKYYGYKPNDWYGYYLPTDISFPSMSMSTGSYYSYKGNSVYMSVKTGIEQCYLVSPEINIDSINKCQVTFYFSNGNSSNEKGIIVGLVSDVNNIPGTFVPVDTFTAVKADGMRYAEAYFYQYHGEAKHVAFLLDINYNTLLASGNKSSCVMYLDEVRIEKTPTCYKVEHITLKDVSSESLRISFDQKVASPECEVKYGPTGFDLETEGTSVVVSTNEVTLTGLTADTDYDVYIRGLCSADDQSYWSDVNTYRTLPEAITKFPYEFNFEDDTEAAKWRYFYIEDRTHWFIGVDTAGVVADGLNMTDKALYVSGTDGLTPQVKGSATAAWAYRYVYLDEGSYTVSFDWSCPGDVKTTTSQILYYDHIRAGLMPATATFSTTSGGVVVNGDGVTTSSFLQNMSSQYATPTGWIELSNKTNYGLYDYYALIGTDTKLSLAEQWQRKSVDIVITKEKAGYYQLVFFWYDDGDAAKYARSGAIDNLSIVSHSCDAPYNVKMEDITHNTAEISWSNLGTTTAPNYEVRVLTAEVNPDEATASQVVFADTVTTPTSAKISGLNFFTEYYVYVRALCSATDSSVWSVPTKFTTLPEPFELGHVFSFEEEELIYKPPFKDEYKGASYVNGYNSSKTSYFHKWFTRTLTAEETSTFQFSSSYFSYYPSVVKNVTSGTKYKYARTGNNCLFFRDYTKNASVRGMTVAMPYAGTFEGTRLVFYMRCFGELNNVFQCRYAVGSSTTRTLDQISRKITVGTMTDPNDPSTFVAIDTVLYPYTSADYKANQNLTKTDPYHNRGWYQAVVNLEGAKGKYVAFRFDHYGTATSDIYNIVYIDDISLVPVAACEAPRDVQVSDLKARSAELNFNYEGTPQYGYYVEVATDKDFTNIVTTDTIETLPLAVSGFSPLTKYYARVKALCNLLDHSEWAPYVEFTTPAEVLYNEEFPSKNHKIDNWTFASAPYSPEEIFSESSTYALNPANNITENTIMGWLMRNPLYAEGNMFSTRHMSIADYATAGYKHYFAFTPVIELKESDKQHLVFDLALTEIGTSNPTSDGELNDPACSFMVLISPDGGRHWNVDKDVIKWKPGLGEDVPGYFDYSQIPNTGRQYSIDLAKYSGKNIQVAFYYFMSGSAMSEMHLDNVHINTYETKEYPATLCEFEDYEDENFFITSDRMTLGENSFKRLDVVNTGNGAKDTVTTITINVCDVAETNFTATICDGSVYNENGFTGLMKEGSYRRKLPSASGCDSVVTVDLTVVPPVYTTVIDTICFGGKYVWNDTVFTRGTIYVDTLVSKVTGCDSIVTLALTVSEVIRSEQYVNICHGDTYTFGSQTISATGKYEEMFKTVDGCDSLVTLHATMLPEYKQTINAVIKEGEEYNSDGFKGLTKTGEYTLELISADGCDSIIILNLKVLKDVTTEESINICFGDSYVFGSQTITESGQYVETFTTADGDSTVVLNATVLPDFRQTIDATICAGDAYNENGFEDLRTTGVYTRALTSVDGCDSTITLNLKVLNGDTTRVEFEITTDDLPYEYQDLYFDKSTAPGTYVDTIIVETENCEDVIIHTLIVKEGVAVDNVNSYDLVMVPNPVAVNGTLYINAEFTPEERDGLVVEVFNAIGQRVYVEYPSIYPIEVTGLAERGMYIVRIIAGNGKSYQGKIIVE